MRQGQYEVLLISEAHEQFEESTIAGKTYFHAQPETQYYVKINVYRDPQTKTFPANYLRIGLFIDGNDVQYWKRLDLTSLPGSEQGTTADKPVDVVSTTFLGFKKNCDEILAFKVAVPSTVSSSLLSSSSSLDREASVGSVRVVFYETRIVDGVYDNRRGIHEIPRHHTVQGEGKKFWQQPSVATSGGKKIPSGKETFTPLQRWENVTNAPIATLNAWYHSPGTILVLKTIHDTRETETSTKSSKRKREDKPPRESENGIRARTEEDTIAVKKDPLTNSYEEEEDDDNDSVSTVEIEIPDKIVPFLDLTCEDDKQTAKWETRIIRKS